MREGTGAEWDLEGKVDHGEEQRDHEVVDNGRDESEDNIDASSKVGTDNGSSGVVDHGLRRGRSEAG